MHASPEDLGHGLQNICEIVVFTINNLINYKASSMYGGQCWWQCWMIIKVGRSGLRAIIRYIGCCYFFRDNYEYFC
ncbi:hypothetical protein NQ318_003652 [Aromia moschata]|uniref:Uncharacterized protein n=1 Tax=Aromia moschata TaxID=1265417 RepID=A0AAV8Y051_9CUCU|nr:hypothetical protein NQ318_003652 [Aromia moschata]